MSRSFQLRHRPRLLHHGLVVVAATLLGVLGHVEIAHAACTASATNICVTHNGSKFLVDTGAGPANPGSITMTVGVTYSFVVDAAVSASHPFAITTSSTGGCSPCTGPDGALSANNVAPGTTVTYTPDPGAIGTIYYQCSNHTNMGGAMTVVAAGSTDLAVAQDLAGVVQDLAGTSTDLAGADLKGVDLAGSPPDMSTQGTSPKKSSGGCSATPRARDRSELTFMLVLVAGVALSRRRGARSAT